MNKSILSVSVLALALALATASLLAACDKPAPAEPAQPAAASEPAAATPAPEAPTTPAAPSAPESAVPAFVGKVWQVKSSSAVAPGTRYSFLTDGTLVIEAEGGTPGYGKWTYENGALTMIEEGVSYPTDILKLDAGAFDIRSHNPGEPVTISMVPAEGAPLPASAPAQ